MVWALATGYNLFKPYHIDDAAHLEIARWIGSHPLHPMSGTLNWSGVEEPIWRTNQPHLYFYILAIWGRLFGFSEPAMHALQSIATLACVFLFHRLVRAFPVRSPAWTTAMLVLGPAFIVEQNLMVDTPLLAAWLAFFNLLICGARDPNQTRRYGLAGLACTAALLIKYSSLVLLPILCISLLLERRRQQAWTAAIPLVGLAAWSAFNYLDYGGVHIATRPLSADHHALQPLEFAIAWIVGLGALTPIGVIAAFHSRASWARRDWLVYLGISAAFVALIGAVALGFLSDAMADKILWLVFAANGALICLLAPFDGVSLVRHALRGRADLINAAPQIYLVLWIAGTTAFYVLFSPFIAARHILLILPAVLLLFAVKWGRDITKRSMIFGLAATISVSAGLCISDWRFAAFYRTEAFALARSLPKTGTLWASGHWGWQWYARQAGFKEVDVKSSKFAPGDIIVVPEQPDYEMPHQPVSLRIIRSDRQDVTFMDPFCTGRSMRLYEYTFREAPWSLSRSCSNTIDIYRVAKALKRPGGSNFSPF